MDGKTEICGICNEKLDGKSQKVNVKKVGLQSLIRASKEREEEKHLNWLDLDELVAHKKCQLGYICKRQIAAAKKRKLKQSQDSAKPKPEDESDAPDSKKSCLICGVVDDEPIQEKVKKSELKKLVSISKELGDDKHLGWADVEEVVVHKKCSADYLSKKAPVAKRRKVA